MPVPPGWLPLPGVVVPPPGVSVSSVGSLTAGMLSVFVTPHRSQVYVFTPSVSAVGSCVTLPASH